MDDNREAQLKLAAAPRGGALPGAAVPAATYRIVPLPSAAVSCAAERAAAEGAADSCLSVEDLVAGVGSVPLAADGAGLIDQLRGLEELKSAVAGLQARIAVAFDAAQRRAQADAGVPAAERGQDVARANRACTARITGPRLPAAGPGESLGDRDAPHPGCLGGGLAERMARHAAGEGNGLPVGG